MPRIREQRNFAFAFVMIAALGALAKSALGEPTTPATPQSFTEVVYAELSKS